MGKSALEKALADGIKARNATKARVYVVPTDPPALVKDYSRTRGPMRVYGRFCLWNEERALRRLAGVRGVPQLRRRAGPDALVMEFVDARPVSELRHTGEIPPDFMERLTALFEAVEARGVAHGDPHYRNILCDAEGMPYLVDFSFCYLRGTLPGIDRWVFDNFVTMRHKRFWKMRRSLGQMEGAEPVRANWLYNAVEGVGTAYKRLRKAVRKKRNGTLQ